MSKRSDRLYCRDVLESGTAIQNYVEGIDFNTFAKDRMRYSAVIREFEIIGEAVGKLSATWKQAHSAIPWQDIKDFRNLLIHEYFGVDLEIVWNTIQDELPTLMATVREIEKECD